MTRPLTEKQHAFALKVFETGDEGKSYLEVYKVKSLAVASSCATKLLRNAKVEEYLEDFVPGYSAR